MCGPCSGAGRGLTQPYLGRLEAHTRPLGGGEVHSLRDAVATAHFGHEGSREANDKLATLLHGPVDLDSLFAQHLRGDLWGQTGLSCTSWGAAIQPFSFPSSPHWPTVLVLLPL